MEGNETGSTQDSGNDSTEYVELNEASDADLDAFLENAEEADGEKKPVVQAQPTEPVKEEGEPQQEPEKPIDVQAQLQAMQKQLQGQELLLKRRTSEIAAVKQQLAQFARVRRDGLEELHLENPTAAIEQLMEAKRAEEAIAQLSQEESELEKQSQAQVLLARYAGPSGFDVDAMAQVLESDDLPADYIQRFRSNPLTGALPETLIQLAKRAEDRKARQVAETQAAQLYHYLQRMMAEQQKAPEAMLRNIQQAMQGGPSITAASGTGGQRGFNPADIHSLSDAELEGLLGE